MLEQLARRMPQTAAKALRPALPAVDHRLKVAFPMGPTPLQAPKVPVHFRPIAGDDAAKPLAQESTQRRGLARGPHREHRETAGHEGPPPRLAVFLAWSR
jgi:hypothetical protein